MRYNDYSTAISYFKKGLSYCHASEDKETKEKLLANMESAYYSEDSLGMAQRYNRKALVGAVSPKDTFFNIYNDGLIAYKRKGVYVARDGVWQVAQSAPSCLFLSP